MEPDFTDFKFSVVITEDEHTLLGNLLIQYNIATAKAGGDASLAEALLQKLHRTREDEILRIRAEASRK